MRLIARTAAVAVVLILCASAAQAADAAWSPGPLYDFLQPYLVAIVQVLMPMLVGWLCLLLHRRFGLDVDQATQDRIAAAASSAAGRIMASQSARFASMAIHIDHPLIAKETDAVVGMLGQIAPPPTVVARMIQGEVGKLQAQASSIPAAVALPAAAVPAVTVRAPS